MQPPTLFCVCWLARRWWQVEATQSSCSCGLQHQHECSPQVTFPVYRRDSYISAWVPSSRPCSLHT